MEDIFEEMFKQTRKHPMCRCVIPKLPNLSESIIYDTKEKWSKRYIMFLIHKN